MLPFALSTCGFACAMASPGTCVHALLAFAPTELCTASGNVSSPKVLMPLPRSGYTWTANYTTPCAAPTAMQTRWTAVGRANRIKGKGDGPFHRAPRETKKSDMGVARECFRVVRRSPAEKEPGMRDEFKAKQCLVSATPRCDNGNAQGLERIKIKQWP